MAKRRSSNFKGLFVFQANHSDGGMSVLEKHRRGYDGQRRFDGRHASAVAGRQRRQKIRRRQEERRDAGQERGQLGGGRGRGAADAG